MMQWRTNEKGGKMGLKMLGARSVASPVGPENQKKGDKKKEGVLCLAGQMV